MINVRKDDEVDHISTPRVLLDAAPKFEDLFEGIQDTRSMLHEARRISSATEAVGMTRGGTMMRVACLPEPLYAAILHVNPGFLKDKAEFYRWLDRHPYYRVGRSIAR